ncbi:MAG TPA: GPW/gp25 family protein [Acidimicrobiales bacterium]|nr:GPW/gp25 family protein [Acidimicrobiales bacterium]
MTAPPGHVAFPHGVDRRGRTAAASDPAYVRQLVAQVLFTAPGERVNRPGFGSGLTQLLFSPADPAVAAAAQLAAQTAIQTWLGDVVVLDDLSVTAEDSTLRVTVGYTLVASGERLTVTFDRGTFAAAGA